MSSKRTAVEELYCKRLITDGSQDTVIAGDTTITNVTVNGTSEFNGAATFDGTAEFNAAATFDSTADFNGAVTFDSTVDFNGAVTLDGDLTSNTNAIILGPQGEIRTRTKCIENHTAAAHNLSIAIDNLSEMLFEYNLTANATTVTLTITDPASLGNSETIKFYVVAHSGDGIKELVIQPDGASCALPNGTSDIVITPASGNSDSRTIFVHKPAAGGTIVVI